MNEKILKEKGLVVRHGALELMEHWFIALSGLVLLLTGMFQMPMAGRYYITSVPGLTWSGDYIVSLYVHYAASVIFIAAFFFHLFFHGLQNEKALIPQRGDIKASVIVVKSFFGIGEEPPFHKYLPEQRLAYTGMALVIALLIISGLIKVYKNVYAPDMNYTVVLWATWVHNIGFILFILAFLGHMGAILLKPNRPMIRGIFTGRVRLDYAIHRHPLWIEDMEKMQKKETPELSEKTEQPVSVDAPLEKAVDENGAAVCGVSEAAESKVESEAAPVVEEPDTPVSDDNAENK
ncbi:MAG: cytochrome b/b6 domain-containing protein [Syntrophaceae bacterium]|nr:cytochrome b/b6 domain-containing protein [Syntrophaceae bacterium]